MSDTLDEKRPTRGDTRRNAIVQAARKVYLEKGLSKITVPDIAGEVGMTCSLSYHCFEDKEAVADAVLDNVIDKILTTLKQWNQAREAGNMNKALDDIVHTLHSLITDESPFSNRMIQDGNAELYIKFIDRTTDRTADYIAQTTVRDFEQMHGLPVINVHEAFFTLIMGLISLVRSHPNISDRTIKEVMAWTLHIESYVVWGLAVIGFGTALPYSPQSAPRPARSQLWTAYGWLSSGSIIVEPSPTNSLLGCLLYGSA